MQRRPVEFQERLARELDRLGMTMGTFVGVTDLEQPSFTSGREDFRADVLQRLRGAIETAQRLRARWFSVIPGAFSPGIPPAFQAANVIDLLRRCCDLCEPAGLTMVVEPLNPWVDHPGMFLTTMSHGYALCRAVGRPQCKLLADIYHQQITEGNLLPTLDRAWDEIAYVQVGDHPGRCEPGTGEINYKNVFQFLRRKGYDGLVGMEHGQSIPGREGELAVLAAYCEADPAEE